ncbi:cobyrinate a,c-diamide synthase [Salininema proteolyticum]|uniref:Hydrogenobyrinate a,c-diamide synthase n=1 Tax=Salininema proteolyticum TaxID=1607685 RepID=A0ABV8U4L4_9ACTN
MVAGPARFMIAGTHSGVGKTLLSAGIMAALRERGHAVAPFKVGPDFIDPGYHSLGAGVPGRNLDAFMQGSDRIAPLLLHGAASADVAVVEGVMGLFDGRGSTDEASSAHIAELTSTPVVLVVDASSASRSVAAQVHGFHTFHPRVRLSGVVFNRVGSDRHEALLRDAVEQVGLPVLGAVRRHDALKVDSRHLGLIPAAEQSVDAVDTVKAAAAIVAREVDLDQLMRLASEAGPLDAAPWDPASAVRRPARPVRVAAASGAAFSFHYAEHSDLLRAAGAEVAPFDPLQDEALPEGAGALYIGGGFPEIYAERLAANERLGADIRRAAEAGMPVVAECGGMLYLCETLEGRPMLGLLDASASFTSRLTLGYREAALGSDGLLGRAGLKVRGHEFHRTATTPSAGPSPAWLIDGHRTEGFSTPSIHASYVHPSWVGTPELVDSFLSAAVKGVRA